MPTIRRTRDNWECQLDIAPPCSYDLPPPVGCLVTESGHVWIARLNSLKDSGFDLRSSDVVIILFVAYEPLPELAMEAS